MVKPMRVIDTCCVGFIFNRVSPDNVVCKISTPKKREFHSVTIQRSLRYVCHNTRFDVGYGSGADQLALAICLQLFSVSDSIRYHRKFKWDYISALDQDASYIVKNFIVPVNPADKWKNL